MQMHWKVYVKSLQSDWSKHSLLYTRHTIKCTRDEVVHEKDVHGLIPTLEYFRSYFYF